MRSTPLSLHLIALAGSVALAFSGEASGCGDPVRDAEIASLGPEDPAGPGPDHRPGTPCLWCHSAGGTASSKAFAVAGTVYKQQTGTDGAESYTIQFVDANGGKPVALPTTGPTGNFYVPVADWPNLAFPMKTAVYSGGGDDDDASSLTIEKAMAGVIGREGSCNFCHRPIPSGDDDDSTREEIERTSIGQIYITAPVTAPTGTATTTATGTATAAPTGTATADAGGT